MYFSKAFLVSALVGFATAQSASSQSIAASETPASMANSTGPAPSSSTSTPSGGSLVTHTIQVGGPNGSLAFFPNNIQANAGDMVQFQFHPKNHSVVQSTFDNPCVPIQNIMANKTDAFFSGFMPTTAAANSTSQLLTYTIRVPDSKPIWFYCSQAKHCQGGMVGAINAPASGEKTMQAFSALAAQASENLSPGQSSGSGGSGSGSASPSGSGAASGAPGSTPTLGAGASGTIPNPAQNTVNAAPALNSQSFFGLGAAAFAVLALW
ncbi:Cupredoxin [Boeremia exigua]|uniref:Cupredoxin n=1 Tax=Boeremia exigua TaxID=749465 RepID=UPI001E8CE2D6|nr:Cupredoxin [Boeremia exigua]KAH6644736.1 Cupredoxin [Boeremia exigua]